ncbi:MAG TPA: arsenic resistance N-acetyltransferase ArsN2 [Gemmatimonadales bacterium]|jgi:amino-acid N-acetyltransferase
MDTVIRPAAPDDLPEILTLLKQSSLPIAGIERHIATILAARQDDTIVGCAAVEVYGAAGLLRSVAVAKDRRGIGLGQQLTRAALELARSRGMTTVYLLTTTADGFFPRFGFERIPRELIDPALEASEELRGACPASAVAMRTNLNTSFPPSRRSSSRPPAPRG